MLLVIDLILRFGIVCILVVMLLLYWLDFVCYFGVCLYLGFNSVACMYIFF